MKRADRRTFLRLAVAGVVAAIGFVWNKLTLNHIELKKQKTDVFPFNKNKTVSFVENYIIINHEDSTKVLSAHCTHLGCIINQTENGRLVCPCHGSEYDLGGNVVKGPAYKKLETIPSKITSDGTHIEIKG